MSTKRTMVDVVLASMMTKATVRALIGTVAVGEFSEYVLSKVLMERTDLIRLAMERTETYIAVYFWERKSTAVPSEISNPGETVNTNSWVTDARRFLVVGSLINR